MYSNKALILFLLTFLIHPILTAQQVRRVSGKVQVMQANTKTAKGLPYASVVVLTKTDSSLVRGGNSEFDGHFNIRYLAQKGKQYLLRVSYMGYATAFCIIDDSASAFDLGNIVLENKGIELKEVTVTAPNMAIRMAGDTIIINASAYRTPEGAYLQDLVRHIPGLEYDEKNHSLTYNGLPIQEINVNGEAFFSGNIRIPLENLPAGFIGSLKVYDKRTDTELATGMDDGAEHYVLDLQTKTEFEKTYLASAQTGSGNNNKKDKNAQFNYFRKGGENFSFYVRSDNKNQNSTYKDNISNSAAVNLAHKFSDNVSLTGNIQYNYGRNGNLTNTYREQYLTNTNQYTSSAGKVILKNRMASSNWRLSWDVDRRTHINVSTRLGLDRNNNQGDNENATFGTSPGLDIKDPFAGFDALADSIKINYNTSLSQNSFHSSRYSCTANVVRQLNEKGTNISFSMQKNGSRNKKHNVSENSTTYFQLEDATDNDSVLYRYQLRSSPAHAGNLDIGTAFTHPFSKRTRLQISYKYAIKNESDNSDTYDLSYGEEQYLDSLENRSHSRYRIHNIGLLFNYSDKIWKINTGMSVTPGRRKIKRNVGTLCADTSLIVNDLNVLLNIVWKNKKNYRVSFVYKGNTRHPLLSQLVPLTDNSNPLNITRGNPGLKNAFSHNFRLDMQNIRKGIFASVNWHAEQNSITQVTTYNEQTGGSETYPENIDGNWRMNVNGRWRKSLGEFRIMLNASGNYANRVSLLHENDAAVPQRSVTRNTGINSSFRLSYQPDWGAVSFDAGNRFSHSLNTLKNNSSCTRNYNFGFDAYANLSGGIQVSTDFTYSFRNGSNLQATDNNEVMWNMRASWRFLAAKQAELSLCWADVLKQRKAYDRNADVNGFYENYTRQIRGYVMISAKYNFRIIK